MNCERCGQSYSSHLVQKLVMILPFGLNCSKIITTRVCPICALEIIEKATSSKAFSFKYGSSASSLERARGVMVKL